MIRKKKSALYKNIFYYSLLMLLASISLFFSFRFSRPAMLPPTTYVAPPLSVQYFAGGFKLQWATSLWLRAMGDLDYCENLIKKNECVGKSWLFKIFDLATELDPPYEPVFYQVAELALTVIVSDYPGASIIFDRGVTQHPDYWQLTYAAAYHSQFEEKDLVKAGKRYSLAAQHGAPIWVGALAGRLATEGGSLELADQILRTMIEMKIDQKYIDRLRKKIEENTQRKQANPVKSK
jgi:hypothetical protein